MNTWKIIPSIVLATVLIFGAGVFTGGFLVHHAKPGAPKKNSAPATNSVSRTTNASPVPPPPASQAKNAPPLPEILSKPFLLKLDERLQLTAEQHKAVEKIIIDGQEGVKKVVRFARLEIREQLTPEQVKDFDALMKRPNRKPAPETNPPPPQVPTPVPPAPKAAN